MVINVNVRFYYGGSFFRDPHLQHINGESEAECGLPNSSVEAHDASNLVDSTNEELIPNVNVFANDERVVAEDCESESVDEELVVARKKSMKTIGNYIQQDDSNPDFSNIEYDNFMSDDMYEEYDNLQTDLEQQEGENLMEVRDANEAIGSNTEYFDSSNEGSLEEDVNEDGEFNEAVTKYAVNKSVEVHFIRNEPTKVRAVCKKDYP
uniref:Transposase MuDR plant domain-containing protein n=1 Tax=Manihot esculenta TaxID=3983 RepID=A0A2C9VR75_MANES